jgi:hypothetical protein
VKGGDMKLITLLQTIDDILMEHGDVSTFNVSVALDPGNRELILTTGDDVIGAIKFT